MLQVYIDRYEKAPETRRRSFWSRLWRHRGRLALFVIALNGVFGFAMYSALRAAGRLPSQERARRENDVFDRWLHSMTFERDIVSPLNDYLSRSVVRTTEIDQLAASFRNSSRFDVPTPSVFVPRKELRTPVIRAWRTTIEQLGEHGVSVYGSMPRLDEGRSWLRQYIEARTPARIGQVELRVLLHREAFRDVAMAEVATQLQVTREELNGILVVANRAVAIRQTSAAVLH